MEHSIIDWAGGGCRSGTFYHRHKGSQRRNIPSEAQGEPEVEHSVIDSVGEPDVEHSIIDSEGDVSAPSVIVPGGARGGTFRHRPRGSQKWTAAS